MTHSAEHIAKIGAALGPLVEALTFGYFTVAGVVENGRASWRLEPYGK